MPFSPPVIFPDPGSSAFADIPGGFVSLEEPNDPINPTGTKCCVSLLSRRRTDSLLVNIKPPWPRGVYADPKTAIGRAAWYSFAFLLRVAAAASPGAAPDLATPWGTIQNPWIRLVNLLPTILGRLAYAVDPRRTFGSLRGSSLRIRRGQRA